MALPPFGSLPPADSPAIMSPPLPLISPPSPAPVVGNPSQPPFSPAEEPSESLPPPPQTPAPSSTELPPAISPPPIVASPPLSPPTPDSASPPEPPQPPVAPEPPSLAAAPSPPPSLDTIVSPVVSPLLPQPKISSPLFPPSIPSLPIPPSPPPQLPPSLPVSPPPPGPTSKTPPNLKTSPPLSAVAPSSVVAPTSLPPPTNPGDPHAFAEAPRRATPPSRAAGAPPVAALPLVAASIPTSLKQQDQIPAGLIVACVVGGVFLFLLLALLLGLVYRCSRRKNHEPETEKPPVLARNGIHGGDLAVVAQQSQHIISSTHGGRHIINIDTQESPKLVGFGQGSGSCSVDSGYGVNLSPLVRYPSCLGGSNGSFTYEELAVATNGFSEGNLVGEGGFGYVHRGVLSNGKEVAVKQLREGRKQGEKEFQVEVEIISRIHHKHLVSLLGYCINGVKRLLVYEFVPNNTLEFHLHGNGQQVMEWQTRLRLAIGSAKGLAYLHEDCDPKILHRDIKASNILVDQNFEAKVADFGLARSLLTADASSISHVSTQVVGTFGYLAPEYASSGKVTEKSDVYSYGVVLLELITGRPPICFSECVSRTSLVEWARPLLTEAVESRNFEALVDPRLQNKYNNGEMTQMVACAAACVRHSAWLRPRMREVVHALEGGGTFAALNLDKGNKPGHSTIFSSSPSKGSSYDCKQYKEEMLKFNNALASGHSGMTSDYGSNTSV